jgi:hypothetical protein
LLIGGAIIGVSLGAGIGGLFFVLVSPNPKLFYYPIYGAMAGAVLGPSVAMARNRRARAAVLSGGYLGVVVTGIIGYFAGLWIFDWNFYVFPDRIDALSWDSNVLFYPMYGALTGTGLALIVLAGGWRGLIGGGILGAILGCVGGYVYLSSTRTARGHAGELELVIIPMFGTISGAIVGAVIGLIWGLTRSYRKRSHQSICSRCGRRQVAIPPSQGHLGICSLCELRARVDKLTDEQRDAIRRLANSGQRSDAIKEAEHSLGISADDAAAVVDSLKQ